MDTQGEIQIVGSDPSYTREGAGQRLCFSVSVAMKAPEGRTRSKIRTLMELERPESLSKVGGWFVASGRESEVGSDHVTCRALHGKLWWRVRYC